MYYVLCIMYYVFHLQGTKEANGEVSFAGGEEFGAELLARFHLGMVGMIVIIYDHTYH